MTLPEPFSWAGPHVAAAFPGGRVLFTTRRGGVSGGPFSSLNLGRLTDDDPAAVDANRARVGEAVGHPWARFAFGRQVHGAAVRRVTGTRAPVQGEEEDGQATARDDVATVVFTADCLPVALVAPGAVAMLHGGWRGLADGIVAEGVRALREVGGDKGEVVAALGPHARGCCYEVGEEVHERFAGHDARVGERNLALDVVATDQLRDAGVAAVHDSGLCTICAGDDLFFSHRRDAGVTGRQGGVAWRA
jgi:YfiH family protein